MTNKQKKWLTEFAERLPEGHKKNALQLWLEDADEDLTNSQLEDLDKMFENTEQCEEINTFTDWVKGRPNKPPHVP